MCSARSAALPAATAGIDEERIRRAPRAPRPRRSVLSGGCDRRQRSRRCQRRRSARRRSPGGGGSAAAARAATARPAGGDEDVAQQPRERSPTRRPCRTRHARIASTRISSASISMSNRAPNALAIRCAAPASRRRRRARSTTTARRRGAGRDVRNARLADERGDQRHEHRAHRRDLVGGAEARERMMARQEAECDEHRRSRRSHAAFTRVRCRRAAARRARSSASAIDAGEAGQHGRDSAGAQRRSGQLPIGWRSFVQGEALLYQRGCRRRARVLGRRARAGRDPRRAAAGARRG